MEAANPARVPSADAVGLRVIRLLRVTRFALLLPWLVLAISLAITYQLWQRDQEELLHDSQIKLDSDANEIVDHIRHSLATHRQMLYGLQGLFAASRNVERDEFHAYFANLQLKERYPGLQGLGFMLIVPAAQKGRHIATVRKEGFPAYTIRPEGKRDIYTPTVYIEPFAGLNLKAFGFDNHIDPARRAAMEQARDSGEAVLSGRVPLPGTEGQANINLRMYAPIYQSGMPHDTLADRRASIAGWVYARYHMDLLMSDAIGGLIRNIGVSIYDGEEAREQALLYRSDITGNAGSALFRSRRSVEVAGRKWMVETYSLPGFEKQIDRIEAQTSLYASIAASLFLALITWLLVRSRAYALRTAQKMNRELIEREEGLRLAHAVFNTVDEGLVVADTDIRIVAVNPAFTAITGYSPDEVIGRNPRLLSAGMHSPEFYRELWGALTATGAWCGEMLNRRKNGEVYTEWLSIKQIRDEQGQPTHYVGIFSDVTERNRAREALRENERRLQEIINTMPVPMFVKDAASRILLMNHACEVQWGMAFSDLRGTDASQFFPPEQIAVFLAKDREVFAAGHLVDLEETVWNAELRQNRIVHTYKKPVFDEAGKPLYLIGMSIDISENKAMEERMQHMAHHDILTGLPNRALLDDRLRQVLAKTKRDKACLAILFIDLDEFKPVNDEFGHAVGDLLLKDAAQRMQGCVRESDTVARIGGDEFVVLLSTIETGQDAMLVAEKIRHVLNQPFELAAHSLRISSSIGIAVYPAHGSDEEALVRNADTAMYHAKEGGRNRVQIYQPWMNHVPEETPSR